MEQKFEWCLDDEIEHEHEHIDRREFPRQPLPRSYDWQSEKIEQKTEELVVFLAHFPFIGAVTYAKSEVADEREKT